jgi:hypothetical protein
MTVLKVLGILHQRVLVATNTPFDIVEWCKSKSQPDCQCEVDVLEVEGTVDRRGG